MLENSLRMKTPEQLRAEQAQPEISRSNNERLGAAALGVPIIGGAGYLGYKGIEAVGNKISEITPTNTGSLIGGTAKNIVEEVPKLVDKASGIVVDGATSIGDAASSLKDDFGEFKNSVAKSFYESTLIAPSTTLTYMVEAIDWKELGNKAKANAGLIIGGAGAAVATGMAMDDHIMGLDNVAHKVDLGTKALGAGIVGMAGAGAGHVAHNYIKKNSADQQEFQDYKAMNEMPPVKNDFKY